MTQRSRNDAETSLLAQAFDITVLGFILTVTMAAVNRAITGQGVIVIICFLAATYMWKLVWPVAVNHIHRYLKWQLLCIAMICLSGWWLVYTAENTRAGWYRFNILSKRVSAFVSDAPAYVIVANSAGRITSTSRNIQTLTGYTPKELTGQPVEILMRPGAAARHRIAFNEAVRILRRNDGPDSGWTLQGLITVGIKHKDGHILPVKAYAGGVRWSTDVQFENDIDMFAVFVPVEADDASKGESTVKPKDGQEIRTAPQPPVGPPLELKTDK
jgi:PAS domain S-box-containing protein